MTYSTLTLTVADGLAVLAFNRPQAMNAVNGQMLADLDAALDRLADPATGARCLLITGEGRGFCAGADLSDASLIEPGPDGSRDVGQVLERHYNPLLIKLRDLPMPVVTAVNGAAAGVGMSFALMGDIVIAAESAYFLQAFRHIGLIPDGGATWLLPRLVGRARALELSLLGGKLPAETAREWGLVTRVAPDARLMEEATALAKDLAGGPTVALTLIRKAYWASLENSYEAQLHYERVAQKTAGNTDDFAEGVAAFLGKRPAVFRGR
ncbi:MAG: enoyl-CoA hydratase/isomerase [Alphaproteobacteria bacterium]|nr:enoyl-CoA hydratase/isomerase [Alphaproteobacteria bacterium]MDX5370711.1 enoyl-CoA hydratase/isomerase [Alphaproteobacteria bacterium]MDX5465128.1 enoyl-CoA hydratase/isomerase [Alphaproteobacteria bacterium]